MQYESYNINSVPKPTQVNMKNIDIVVESSYTAKLSEIKKKMKVYDFANNNINNVLDKTLQQYTKNQNKK